jgi:ribosomal-protein-alanine N-acetyltransferase
MGYNVARQHWGRGYATEAALAVLKFAFDQLQIASVMASADTRNVGSLRVMQKLGMRHEVTLPSHRIHHGESVDEVRYTLTKQQFEQNAAPHRVKPA